MSQVQYSRLPMGEGGLGGPDDPAFDFSSPFSYKSVFTYSKAMPPYLHEETEFRPSFLSKVFTYVAILVTYIFLVLTFPLSGWFSIKNVQQFERIVVFRLGHLQTPKGPGCILINPFIDKWRRVDMRTRAFNVPPQQLITTDGSAISAGATVYHRIMDVALSVAAIQDMDHSLRTLGHTVLLNLLSSRDLSVINREKGFLEGSMQEDMNGITQGWGVEISRAEISEITVIQEAEHQSFNMEKVSSMFTQVAGHMSGGTTSQAQPPSAFASLLSMATGRPSSTSHQQPRLTVPRDVPVTSTLVEMSGQSALTPRELLELAEPVLDEELVEEIGAVFKFVVEGEAGGTFFLDLKTGAGHGGAGEPTSPPDVTLTMTVEDMQAMFGGQLRPSAAYMMGRLRVEGDRNVALALEKVINRIQEEQ